MDDPIGRILKNQPGKWTLLNLPAFAETDDPLGRVEGAALWTTRFPEHVLHDLESTLGEYSFSALYQQRPTPAEGGTFKRAWFHIVDHAPKARATVRYWDLAMSEKTSADYTVGVKYALCEDGHRYVLDVARKQIDWGDLTDWMAAIILADGAEVAQGIEEKGYMSRAIPALVADYRFHSYDIRGHKVDKDKVTRALPAAAKAQAGLVHVVDNYWTSDFIEELCSFPNGTHDDQVDAFSGAETMMGDQLIDNVGGLNYSDGGYSQGDY
jgi:predicted phage terminase large subunit-like protein